MAELVVAELFIEELLIEELLIEELEDKTTPELLLDWLLALALLTLDEETPAASVYSTCRLSITRVAELSARSAINEVAVPIAGVIRICWPTVKLLATASNTFEFAP